MYANLREYFKSDFANDCAIENIEFNPIHSTVSNGSAKEVALTNTLASFWKNTNRDLALTK